MSVKIANFFEISDTSPLTVFAGPCVVESRDLAMHVAESAKKSCEKLQINYVFKSSYEKANRSSLQSYTGPGIDEGLKILEEVKKEFNLPIITDIHLPSDAIVAAEVADVLQIPAFLCRQTELVLAAGYTGKAVNIKKGQFLAPEQMKNIAEKVVSVGNKNVMLCERGTTFGYGDLVVDPRSFKIMRELGYQVVFDCTHSVQKPGGEGTRSGGSPEFIESLAKAALSGGFVNTLFMEIHPDPLKGLSDATNMLRLDRFESLVNKLKQLHEFAKELRENA